MTFELEHFAFAIAQIGFLAGLLGAFCWSLFESAASYLADVFHESEARKTRIAQARLRALYRTTPAAPFDLVRSMSARADGAAPNTAEQHACTA